LYRALLILSVPFAISTTIQGAWCIRDHRQPLCRNDMPDRNPPTPCNLSSHANELPPSSLQCAPHASYSTSPRHYQHPGRLFVPGMIAHRCRQHLNMPQMVL
jgi:hypothetical protein